MHIRSIAAPLLKWFAGNARDLPWRRTRDPYAIWVSEIMLQQTQVKTVIPYWQRWMEQLPDIASLAAADEDTVIKLWEGLGYYSRARNLQKAAKLIGDELGGRFPRDLVGVLALPGVGRYTGGAICSIAYNQAGAARRWQRRPRADAPARHRTVAEGQTGRRSLVVGRR